jgi:hypothetical protein
MFLWWPLQPVKKLVNVCHIFQVFWSNITTVSVGSQCFMEAFSWMSEFITDLFAICFCVEMASKNKKTFFVFVFLRLGFDE